MAENEITIELDQVVSSENYVRVNPLTKEEEYFPVLQDITMSLYEGQVLGISAKNPYETQTFCRIVGNIIPYYSGNCILGRRGMTQKKRVVLDHVFYIDVHSMVYDNMTVLEYLMFATEKSSHINTVTRQEQIFESLIKIGLGHISLSLIKDLTPDEKILIELLTATYSKSKIIILELTRYEFTLNNIHVLKKLCDSNRKKNKTIVIGTKDAKLIGICCDYAAFILDGKLRYFGTVEELYKQADHVLYVLSHSSLKELYNQLLSTMPEYNYKINESENMIYVMKKFGGERNDALFFDKLSNNNIFPDNVKINRGRVQNSFEELIGLNDL